jgi:4-hydroxy-tetrahydrodipicolinate reductase
MKIALIGYGAMGRLTEQSALAAGHEVHVVGRSRGSTQDVAELAARLKGSDVVIDFTVAEAVLTNVEACMMAGVPLVEGTTGWKSQEDDVKSKVSEYDGGLVYGANFSIGVNLFYRLVSSAAELLASVDLYDVFIEEAHHKRKRDAPSGTALALRDVLSSVIDQEIPVTSTRAGYIPGTHRVGFDSPSDQITLTHTARSREGFAAGAIFAAEWISSRKGVYEFSQLIDEHLKQKVADANDPK